MTVAIRQATDTDAHVLAQLLMTVHNAHRDVMPDRYRELHANDPAVIEYFETAIAAEGNVIFMAEFDNEPVGYISCQIRQIPDHLLVYGMLRLHIDQMSVNEAHQGQGIGKALMTHVLAFAKSEGVEQVTLGVMPFNEKAIGFYKKLGFEFASHRMGIHLA